MQENVCGLLFVLWLRAVELWTESDLEWTFG